MKQWLKNYKTKRLVRRIERTERKIAKLERFKASCDLWKKEEKKKLKQQTRELADHLINNSPFQVNSNG